MGAEPLSLQAGLMTCYGIKTYFADKCAVFFESLSKSSTSTRGAVLRSSGYYVCAPCELQAGETGFYNTLSSLEAGNPGYAQIPPLITDAKIGKVFHARLCLFSLYAFAKNHLAHRRECCA